MISDPVCYLVGTSFRLVLAILVAAVIASARVADRDVFTTGYSSAQVRTPVIISDTAVDDRTLTIASNFAFSGGINGMTFQQDALITWRGWQYAAYYTGDRRVAVARRKLPGADWESLAIEGYIVGSNDTHNVVSLGLCPNNGTLHLAFDHHGSNLHYVQSATDVISDPGNIEWEDNLFGTVESTFSGTPVKQLTYPRFITTPQGNLLFTCRLGSSGNGDSVLFLYDGITGLWDSFGTFISRSGTYTGNDGTSNSRNAYFDYFQYDTAGRLHATWVFREKTGPESNHDIHYTYSDDNGVTWRNNAGEVVAITGTNFIITVDSPGIVAVPIEQRRNLANSTTMIVDSVGQVHVMARHLPEDAPNSNSYSSDAMRYHHHWRNLYGIWRANMFDDRGTRPKLLAARNGDLYLVYGKDDELCLAVASASSAWSDWHKLEVSGLSDYPLGSETLVDYSRFEAEGPISIFYTVKTGQFGSPAPLQVTDLQVSEKAVAPSPGNDAISVVRIGRLSWSAGLGATSHDVYLGTDAGKVRAASIDAPEYLGRTTESSFDPGDLMAAQTYHWRIDSVRSDGTVVNGRVWSFTTSSQNLTTGAAFFGAQEVVPDWVFHETMDWIYTFYYPHVWSIDLGWLYLTGDGLSSGTWFWSYSLRHWIYTRESLLPYYFSTAHGWITYDQLVEIVDLGYGGVFDQTNPDAIRTFDRKKYFVRID